MAVAVVAEVTGCAIRSVRRLTIRGSMRVTVQERKSATAVRPAMAPGVYHTRKMMDLAIAIPILVLTAKHVRRTATCQLTDETNCLVCCEVCRSCPDFSGDGFPDQACKTVCVKKSELGDGSPCTPPSCPPPPDPPDGSPPIPPEPCDCNCDNDCGYCEICNAAGECEPDPACTEKWVAYLPHYYEVRTEYCNTGGPCTSGPGQGLRWTSVFASLVEDSIPIEWVLVGTDTIVKPIGGCERSCSEITVRNGDSYSIYKIGSNGVPRETAFESPNYHRNLLHGDWV